jgi:NADH-quinone oxidoreductase subunit H
MTFAQFFLGENINIILMCTLTVILFIGGWLPPTNFILFYFIPGFLYFSIKILLLLFSFIWVRTTFPRYRYDQLMRLGWKIFLPLSLAWVIFIAGIILAFNISII